MPDADDLLVARLELLAEMIIARRNNQSFFLCLFLSLCLFLYNSVLLARR